MECSVQFIQPLNILFDQKPRVTFIYGLEHKRYRNIQRDYLTEK